MGYIKKEFQEKLRIMDYRYYNFPEYWEDFISKIKINHNLIIKRKGTSICTNCKHEFNMNKKVGEYQECPNCHNTYLVKSAHLKKFNFIDTLILLDKVENDLVFRYFEMLSVYNNESNDYEVYTSVVEYARSFFEKDVDVVNDRVSKCQGYIHIKHCYNPGKWREYTRYYNYNKNGYVYSYNLKKILNNTEYKYLNFRDFIENIGKINFEYLLSNIARRPCFEMLTKLKLYNLALKANKFSNGKSFYQTIGVPKDFYSFMKRNNITYDELRILRLLKEKNIKKIRYLLKYNVDALEQIVKYISLNKFLEYAKNHKGKVDVYIYKDYLRFAKLIGLDLKNKKYIYPDNLKQKHDELEKSYEIHSRELLNKSIINRYNELKKNIYKDDEYIIIPAKSVEDLEKESKEQMNCVRTYSEKYATGICDIYFMRQLTNMQKSYVTVEVKNNEVVQSGMKYNNMTENEQLLFLEKWQEKILKCRV